ncbi:MAG: 4Fe-4S dicluster domain-containing protein [Planctomycetes bacterium]|nr:4Fe-4S dicluster domain-containing protein [Planctomycetota bacterium]
MGVNRRGFLKAAALGTLGLSGAKAGFELLSGEEILASAEEKKTEGRRWAMAIDLHKFNDEVMHRVTTACHTAHNVPRKFDLKDADEARWEIKWIWGEEFHNTFPDQAHQHVADEVNEVPIPVFCNHCDNPPCVRVCPTQATFRREDGIVIMDWHRCIGCRYCIAACPYGSRSFNWVDPRKYIEKIDPRFPTRCKGVVEKCTLCDERIAIGKEPACVEACQNQEMIFGDLHDETAEIRNVLKTRFSIRRKPGLGTQPEIYYLV